MSSPLPASAFYSVLDDHLPADRQSDLAEARCALYADAYDAAIAGPIAPRVRRRMVRQARRVGIDAFEAHLLINGACLRAGLLPDGSCRLRVVWPDSAE